MGVGLDVMGVAINLVDEAAEVAEQRRSSARDATQRRSLPRLALHAAAPGRRVQGQPEDQMGLATAPRVWATAGRKGRAPYGDGFRAAGTVGAVRERLGGAMARRIERLRKAVSGAEDRPRGGGGGGTAAAGSAGRRRRSAARRRAAPRVGSDRVREEGGGNLGSAGCWRCASAAPARSPAVAQRFGTRGAPAGQRLNRPLIGRQEPSTARGPANEV